MMMLQYIIYKVFLYFLDGKKETPWCPRIGKVTIIDLGVSPSMTNTLFIYYIRIIYKEFTGNEKNASSILR